MNLTDLQIIEDFNAQCEEVALKIEKLIKYLQECSSIEIDSEQKEVEVLKYVELGLDSFDLYSLVDFIEGEQANELQIIVNNYQNKYLKSKYSEFLSKIINYNNSLEQRMAYLDTIQKNNNETYYKFDSNQTQVPHSQNEQESEPMEIEYNPRLLTKTNVFSKLP